MDTTIFDIMSDDLKKIDEFKAACDIMLKTQYILVDSKITAMLQTIAASKLLYSLFYDLLKDFDYRRTAKACIVSDGSYARIKMPDDPKVIASLVFCILLDMDKKAIELRDFLDFFDGGGDTNAAYDSFLRQVILPFKNSVTYLITNILDELKAAAPSSPQAMPFTATAVAESAATATAPMPVLPEVPIDAAMAAFMGRIKSDDKIHALIKDYLIILCSDLVEAVGKKETKRAQNIQKILSERLRTYKPSLCKEVENLPIEQYVALAAMKNRKRSGKASAD